LEKLRFKMDFQGRTSIVTGASQGIGKAIALELSREGVEVILVDIQKEKLEEVADKIRENKGKAVVFATDVSRLDEAMEVVEAVVKSKEKIDHLVNNAGITRDNLLMRMKEEEWDSVLKVNLKGVFNFSKAVIRNMINNRYGRIVNISSIVGLIGNVGQCNYSASKAGVIGFTKSLAREVASRGITVNAVAPGYIATQMTESLPESVQQKFRDWIPVKRFGTPEEITHAVKFLLSDEAAYITGQVINVNGGMFM
jgi:3-oxoacyl-[acyl-carrier protein] reductase